MIGLVRYRSRWIAALSLLLVAIGIGVMLVLRNPAAAEPTHEAQPQAQAQDPMLAQRTKGRWRTRRTREKRLAIEEKGSETTKASVVRMLSNRSFLAGY